MTAGVICVFAEEIGLLFYRSHFLLRELLPHEPVDVSILRLLLNEKKKILDLQAVLYPGLHNDNHTVIYLILQNPPGKNI